MSDFFLKSLENLPADMLEECDAYTAKLAARKAARSRRRRMAIMYKRVAALAVVLLVVSGALIGGRSRDKVLEGKPATYIRYNSFQEAINAIGKNTLLSRMPAAETEYVAIYDRTQLDAGDWADVICIGTNMNFRVLLEIALEEEFFPETEELLYVKEVAGTEIHAAEIRGNPIWYAVFEKSVLVKDASVVAVVFSYQNIYYRFQYRVLSGADSVIPDAFAYLEVLLTPA